MALKPEKLPSDLDHIKDRQSTSFLTMQEDLAQEHKADKTCPVSTGIFFRISAEAAYKNFLLSASDENMTPFWRVIDETMKVAKKLPCRIEFLREHRQKEGL